jgi:acrylyl-CoA reductase (NADPH)
MAATIRALVLEQGADKKVTSAIKEMPEDQLPPGEVTVKVEYSTVNYKDGMIVTTGGRLVRNWPHVGGIDLVGTVEKSDSPDFKPGDKVLVNGYRLGELFWGGYATKARLKAEHLVRLPKAISAKRSMAIGTAGYTSMLCVLALEKHGIKPADGEILVTGAAGGVGSVALAILKKLGYQAVAATGRPEEADYLKSMGAASVIERKELLEAGEAPLLSERYAGVIDTVSGVMLGRALAQIKWRGAAAVCGLASGVTFPGNIMPFILRGISMYGIDSVMLPMQPRQEAWDRLATDLPLDKLDAMTVEATLGDVPQLALDILKGKVRGRVVVDVNR